MTPFSFFAVLYCNPGRSHFNLLSADKTGLQGLEAYKEWVVCGTSRRAGICGKVISMRRNKIDHLEDQDQVQLQVINRGNMLIKNEGHANLFGLIVFLSFILFVRLFWFCFYFVCFVFFCLYSLVCLF